MKELKICRSYKDKFTVAVAFPDYGAFAYDGLFPTKHKYYRIDTEEELTRELSKEEVLFADEVEAIYYIGEDVTEKYLELIQGESYRLKDCWRVTT
jgi:hypothetical protein